MFAETIASYDAHAVNDGIMYLAQNNSVTLDGNMDDPPTLNIKWPPSVINIARVISVLCGLSWVIFAASKFMSPSSQGGGGSLIQKMGGIGPLLAGAVSVMVFWDLDNTTKVLNAFMRVGYMIWSWLTSGLGSIGE